MLQKVAELEGWNLEPFAGIAVLRRYGADGRERDPVTAVCENETGEFFPTNQWRKAASRLGLAWHPARSLVRAADGGYGPELRAKLLKAAGRAFGRC